MNWKEERGKNVIRRLLKRAPYFALLSPNMLRAVERKLKWPIRFSLIVTLAVSVHSNRVPKHQRHLSMAYCKKILIAQKSRKSSVTLTDSH